MKKIIVIVVIVLAALIGYYVAVNAGQRYTCDAVTTTPHNDLVQATCLFQDTVAVYSCAEARLRNVYGQVELHCIPPSDAGSTRPGRPADDPVEEPDEPTDEPVNEPVPGPRPTSGWDDPIQPVPTGAPDS